jgi:hypothetical protein
MRLPRPGLIVFLLASLFAAAPASAVPSITGQILQCDGTYASGVNTHLPAAQLVSGAIRAQVQDASGLRIGTARMGIIATGSTRAEWRFDDQATLIQTSCVADAVDCPTNGFCAGYVWSYSDSNGSPTMTTGLCVYDQPCAGTGSLFGGIPPIGQGACPATTPSSPMTIFPVDGSNHFPVYPGTNSVATFNGAQYSSVPYSGGTWDLGATYTLSAWFKTASAGAQYILSQQNGGEFVGFGVNAGGVWHRDSRDATVGTSDVTKGSGLNNGAWHQIHVVRRNGTDIRFYADGALITTVVASSTGSFLAFPIQAPVMLGSLQGASNFFNGTIDEIRVTDAALNDDQVYLEYNGSVHHKYSSNSGATFAEAAGSFAGGPSNGAQGLLNYTPGEAYTATSQWIFEAQSTQTATTILSAFTPVIDTARPVAPALTGTPTTTNDITWSWGAPGKVCQVPSVPYFQLVDEVSGAVITPANTVHYPADTSIGENVPGSPNQLRSRGLIITDVWGTSNLSASATAYTLAANPVSLAFSNVSTGGFTASWSANGNPAYTRYELSYARDAGFTVGLTTRAGINDNLTATSVGVNGLAIGTTYFLRVRSYNGRATDPYGGAGGTYLTGTFVTQSGAPALAGAPLSPTSVNWSWSTVPGASGYTLYDSPTQAVMLGPGAAAVTFTSGPFLSPNTRYDAEVEATMPAPTPVSPRGHAFTYTLADPPTGTAVSAIYQSSVAITWNRNGNPAGTFYQIVVASDVAFNVIVATINVATTNVTVANLVTGGTYYAKVQAINGVQIETAFDAAVVAALPADPKITSNPSPNSPYVASSQLVGAWQFDESTGTFSVDASTYGDNANLVCVLNGCVSTPTWTAGPTGLGSGLAFNGLSGAVLSTVGTPFAFTDSLTVEAWVDPATTAQQNGAGIVARGNLGSEDFALDVSGGKFRFIALPAKIATAPSVLSAGVWTHVVGVYDSVAQTATLYLNGVAAASVGAAAPPRTNSGQVLSIGNRPNALGSEALGFAGSIDSVRVFHRALAPAEVLADYQGGFVSSVTPAAPNFGVIVALPPNAFGAPAQILISADPVGHPIKIPSAALSAGLAALPAGLTMVPNSLIEVVPIVGGLPFTTPLGSSAALSIPYTDADSNGIIDGTNPPLAASSVMMYTLNTTVNRWELLPTSVDTAHHRATGITPHFSVFALFAPVTIGSSINGVTVYPVPWKPGTRGRFDAAGVTFANLPPSGTIRILNLAGARVREFSYSGLSAGVAVWDGLTDQGRRAASGVYFARITGTGGTALVKFAIER